MHVRRATFTTSSREIGKFTPKHSQTRLFTKSKATLRFGVKRNERISLSSTKSSNFHNITKRFCNTTRENYTKYDTMNPEFWVNVNKHEGPYMLVPGAKNQARVYNHIATTFYQNLQKDKQNELAESTKFIVPIFLYIMNWDLHPSIPTWKGGTTWFAYQLRNFPHRMFRWVEDIVNTIDVGIEPEERLNALEEEDENNGASDVQFSRYSMLLNALLLARDAPGAKDILMHMAEEEERIPEALRTSLKHILNSNEIKPFELAVFTRRQLQNVRLDAKVDSSAVIDCLWAQFFATGDAAAVRSILKYLRFEKDDPQSAALEYLQHCMVLWSLAVNSYQHPTVFRICQEALAADPSNVKLRQVIDAVKDRKEVLGEYKHNDPKSMSPLRWPHLADTPMADGTGVYKLIETSVPFQIFSRVDIKLMEMKEKAVDNATRIMENNPYFNQEKKQIKIGLMEERILSMWEHAADYPVQFPSEEAKERFISDLKLLISTWLLVSKGEYANLGAKLYHMAYNLDLPEALLIEKKKPSSVVQITADSWYNIALDVAPKSGIAHFRYGVFLGTLGSMPGVAIHFLERAVELGYIAAHYSLAIQWIYLQQVDKARVNLNEYLKHFPEDESAKQVLQSLDSNQLSPAFTNFGDQSPAQLPPS